MVSLLKRIAYTVLQCTWGIIQTLAGAVVFLALAGREHFIYRGAVGTMWRRSESLSLGMFIFISEQASPEARKELCAHEYGHTVQSLILGVLYLPVIVLPSSLWCMLPFLVKRRGRKNISYYSFYTEKWANRIAEKLTGINFGILI